MLAAGSKVAGALFVMAVLLERSLAVLNSLLFEEEERVARTRFLEGDDTTPGALDVVKAKDTTLRLAIGFVAAICVSAAGIRTLEALAFQRPMRHFSRRSTYFLRRDCWPGEAMHWLR
jgi:hypothetical protein